MAIADGGGPPLPVAGRGGTRERGCGGSCRRFQLSLCHATHRKPATHRARALAARHEPAEAALVASRRVPLAEARTSAGRPRSARTSSTSCAHSADWSSKSTARSTGSTRTPSPSGIRTRWLESARLSGSAFLEQRSRPTDLTAVLDTIYAALCMARPHARRRSRQTHTPRLARLDPPRKGEASDSARTPCPIFCSNSSPRKSRPACSARRRTICRSSSPTRWSSAA